MKDLSKKMELGKKTAEIVNNTQKLLATSLSCLAQSEDYVQMIDYMIEVLQSIKLGAIIDKELDNEDVSLEDVEIKVSDLEKRYEELRKTAKEVLEKMI